MNLPIQIAKGGIIDARWRWSRDAIMGSWRNMLMRVEDEVASLIYVARMT